MANDPDEASISADSLDENERAPSIEHIHSSDGSSFLCLPSICTTSVDWHLDDRAKQDEQTGGAIITSIHSSSSDLENDFVVVDDDQQVNPVAAIHRSCSLRFETQIQDAVWSWNSSRQTVLIARTTFDERIRLPRSSENWEEEKNERRVHRN